MRAALLLAAAIVACRDARAQVATVREWSTEVECTGPKSATVRERRVTTIHNEHGNALATFHCWCGPGDDLSRFSGEITDATGKVVKKVKKGELTRSEYSTEFKSDDYFYYYEYSPVSYPVTVTYEWEEKLTGGLRAYPMFAPQTRYEVDVERATYRFIATPDNTMRWHARNFEPEVVTREEGGRKITEFKLENLPAVKRYSYARDLDELVPSVVVAPLSFTMEGYPCDMSDWRTFGQWVYSLQQGRDVLPEAIRQKVHQLTDTCTTDRSRVGVLRGWMGDNMRYISIQLGIGGYQTMTADEVLRMGMGDCKALTNLLCALLGEVGVTARYALISTEYRDLFPDFPSFSQLNHVIAQVPLEGDTLWVECTNPRIPIDSRPTGWAGHEVVLITPEGGVLARVPVVPDEENTEHNTIRIAVEANGNAAISLRSVEQNRCFEHDMRLAQMTAADQRKAMLNSLRMPKATISALDVRTEGKRLHLDMEAKSEGYGRVSGTRIFIPFSLHPYEALRNPKEEPHAIDLENIGYVSTDSITMVLPEGYGIESVPKPQVVESDFGSYRLESSAEGNEVKIVATFEIRSGVYPAEQYEAWVKFRSQVAAACDGKVIVRRTGS